MNIPFLRRAEQPWGSPPNDAWRIHLLPESTLSSAALAEVYCRMVERIERRLIARAIDIASPAGLVIREARPYCDLDLGLTIPMGRKTFRWHTPPLKGGTWNDLISTCLPSWRLLAFYAIYDLSLTSIVSEVRFGVGSSRTTIRAMLPLHALHASFYPRAFLSEAVFYMPNEFVSIDVFAEDDAPDGVPLGFGALVCEPLGPHISGPEE